MFLKFFVIFAAIVAMMYLATSTDNKPGVLLLAAVISVVFVILSSRSENQELRRRYRMKPNTFKSKGCSRGGSPAPAQHYPNKFTDTLVASTIPQVDSLSRSIDDKMAINQTSNPLYVPGGVNTMFEAQLI